MAGHSGLYVTSADIRRVLLGSDDNASSYINFIAGSDSDVDFAQEENWNYTDRVVEEVKNDDVTHV